MTICLIIAVTVLAACLPVAYSLGIASEQSWKNQRGTRLSADQLNEQTNETNPRK